MELSPETVQALVQMGVLDEQGNLLNEQLDQAKALQQPRDNPYGHTPWGALLGGAANALDSYRGTRDAKRLREERAGMLNDRASILSKLLGAGGGSGPEAMNGGDASWMPSGMAAPGGPGMAMNGGQGIGGAGYDGMAGQGGQDPMKQALLVQLLQQQMYGPTAEE